MSRNTVRAGVAAALMLTIASGLAAPAMASGSPNADSWFAHLTPAQIVPFVKNFPSWRTEGTSDAHALSFGTAAPTLGYSLPSFDLRTNKVSGSTTLTSGLRPTGGYCARLLIKKAPSAIVICGEPTPTGTFQLVVASQVQFLGGSADLPTAGTTDPDHNFVGVVKGAVVPMDRSAKSWMGASQLNGSTFVTLVAKRVAEWNAINKINGPSVGGDIPLVGGPRGAVAQFEAAVAKGSGIPASRLSHAWTVPGIPGSGSGSSTGWIVPVGTLAALMGVAIMATRRRQHAR